jgi:hypothetical protein
MYHPYYPTIGFQNEELEEGLCCKSGQCLRLLPPLMGYPSCRRHCLTFSVRVTIKFAEGILPVTAPPAA